MRKLSIAVPFVAVSFVAVFGAMQGAAAQSYPSRPITIIVPFPAGGATDTLARVLAEPLRGSLGQSVVIENVAGAAGSIGVGRAVRAPADGYTLSIGTLTTHVLIGALYALQFDLTKDLEPIAQLGAEPLLISARKSMPASDLQELIGWLKANPDKASAGIAGVGATGHVTGLSFQKETGTRFQFVPYRGNGPALQDLLAGQIKAYAVTAGTRLHAAPDIPTVDQAGLAGFYASLWYGLWVPKGTPKEIVATLNAAVVDALAAAPVRARLAELGLALPPREQQTPEALRAFQRAEVEKWWPIIKAANIRGE